MSAVVQMLLAVGGSPIEWTFVASATSTAAGITVPGSAQEGDLAILADFARQISGSPTLVTPAGWTGVATTTSTGRPVMRTSGRLLGASPGGTSVTGMDGNFADAKAMIVLRPSRPVTLLDLQSLNNEYTANNPTPQVIACAAGQVGMVAVAVFASGAAVAPRTFSPAEDGEVSPGTTLYLKYKVFNTSPADITVDMDDEGSDNFLVSFYVGAT